MLTNFAHIEKDEKSVLRRFMRDLATDLSPAPVAARLLASEIWREAASVALYAPLPTEVDALPLLEDAWHGGKLVCLPRITARETRSMEFLPCAALAELERGPFRLLEPKGGLPVARVDLLVIPALAFDRRGYRLGRGGGYYDRFLAAHPDFAALRLGLCHSRQVLERLPADPWDAPVQALCTEEGIVCL